MTFKFVFIDLKHLLSVNNHPVHLSNTKRSQTALIPFCAFGEDMEKMGTHIDGIDVPVCNSFIPKNHDHQLCYEVDLNRFRNNSSFEEQLRSGLVLLLDFNEMRQLDVDKSNVTHKNMFSEDEENSFTIYFDTISKIASFLFNKPLASPPPNKCFLYFPFEVVPLSSL